MQVKQLGNGTLLFAIKLMENMCMLLLCPDCTGAENTSYSISLIYA